MEPNQKKVILFTIFLTGFLGFKPFFWLNICKADRGYNPDSTNEDLYDNMLQILGTFPPEKLPFEFQIDYMEHLRNISPKYKNLYMNNYLAELDKKGKKNAPILALKITINEIFEDYENRAPEHQHKLKLIRLIDPIGLIFFETKEMMGDEFETLNGRIDEFYQTMSARILLFNCRKNLSLIHDPSWESDGYYRVERTSCEHITTEWRTMTAITIEAFLKIAMENFPQFELYESHDASMNYKHYKEHKNRDADDVQILFDGPPEDGHWFCIKYDGILKKVIVYDKKMKNELEPIHREIIRRLYPNNEGIIYRSPFTYQTDDTSCGLYSIMYATMIILGKEPGKEEIPLNYVLGDEGLYMRLHILKMFVHRKLAMPEDWSKMLIPEEVNKH